MDDALTVRRLGWAGVEVTAGGTRAVVDLLEEVEPRGASTGPARAPLPPPSGPVDVALVTHLHTDHADPKAIAAALKPGGLVLRPAPTAGDDADRLGSAVAEHRLTKAGLEQRVVAPWEAVRVGALTCTAVPAVDGFGEPQVSWVLEAGGRRVLHAGDTMAHGCWWSIARRLGPIDVAALPVNGARVRLPAPFAPPSPLPAVMGPQEAAAAAHVLQAGVAVPIHYDTFHAPPAYVQVDDPAGAFVAAAERLGVPVRVLAPGQALEP